jgi:hypothetical protein
MRHVAEMPDIGFAAPVGLPPGRHYAFLVDDETFGAADREPLPGDQQDADDHHDQGGGAVDPVPG